MGLVNQWRKRIAALVDREAADRDLDEEITMHLELETERLVREGVEPGEARRRAAAAFGGVSRFREETREARFFAWVGHIARDVRYALRSTMRRPGYVAAILLTLTLGIGASVAVFAAANALFFRPLPFADESRLMLLYETNPEFKWVDAQAAPANYLDWRERVSAFDDVAAYNEFTSRATYIRDGEPHLISLAPVSGNFFDVLGVRPALGRAFTWDETWSNGGRVIVLAHTTWEAVFGSDSGIVGRTVDFAGTPVLVAGVMPRGFTFPTADVGAWIPFSWNPANRDAVFFRRAHNLRPIAKLAPGVSAEAANAEFQVEIARLQQEYPETNRVMGGGMMPLRSFLMKDVRKPALILMGAVAFLLMLACTNIANLALLRALGRQQEITLRHALGASRARVATSLAIEHGVLALLGGALGTVVGWSGLRALGFADFGIAATTTVAMDARVWLFAVTMTLCAAIAFSATPLLLSARHGDGASLRAGERGASSPRTRRLAQGLVALEVALAVLLVAGAGLMARTAVRLRTVDVGFQTENVLAVQFSIPSSRYQERDAVLAFYDQFLAAVEARPGIQSTGSIARLPLTGTSWTSSFHAASWPPEKYGVEILHRSADRGYFETVGTPLIRGRHLDESGRRDGPFAIVVNETFAKEFFPGEDPIGQRIAYDRVPTETSAWYEIVGIVGDQKQTSPARPTRAEVFESRDQDWGRSNWIVIRTSGPALAAVPIVRDVLREMDPLIPLATVRTLDDVRRESIARENTVLVLLSAFGVLALVLATVGVYAVAAQAARQRTREIGIRVALGASADDIVRLVLRQGFVAVAIGLAVGLGVTLVATRALDSLLYGVAATDPLTIGGVAVVLLLVGAIACWIPARWAARLDPAQTLKME